MSFRLHMAALLIAACAAAESTPPGAVASPPLSTPPPLPTELHSLEATLQRVANLLLYQTLELPTARPLAETKAQPNAANDLLLRMFASKDAETRVRAVEGLAASGEAEADKHLFQALFDQDSGVQTAALRALQGWDAAKLLNVIRPPLEAQDPAFLAQAPRIFPAFQEKLGQPFLELLEAPDSTPLERLASAYALGQMAYQPAGSALAAGIRSADASFSRTCATALLGLGPASRQKDWLALLSHPDPQIAWIAIGAVRQAGGRQGLVELGALAAGATRQEEGLQLQAMQAAGDWPLRESVPVLINVMARNKRLASPINKLLASKTSKDFGPSAELWATWWVQTTGQPSPLPPPPAPAQAPVDPNQTRAAGGIINP